MSTDAKPTSSTPVLTIAEGKALIRLNRPAEHNRLEPADLVSDLTIFNFGAGGFGPVTREGNYAATHGWPVFAPSIESCTMP